MLKKAKEIPSKANGDKKMKKRNTKR